MLDRPTQTDTAHERLAKLDDVIRRQRDFLYRIADPDTRQRAEEHLIALVDMRDELCVGPNHREAW